MEFKNWFFAEQVLENGSAIVYHRTKEGNPQKILARGFLAGGGDVFGKALYATFSLENQNKERAINLYGPYIVKWHVPDLSRFVIFTPLLAKKIHGVSEITLQVKKITGKDIEFEDIGWRQFQGAEALNFTDRIISQYNLDIDGIIYNNPQDGTTIVAYKFNNWTFTGLIYAPKVLDEKQLNNLNKNQGWINKSGYERLKNVYQLPTGVKRSQKADKLQIPTEKFVSSKDLTRMDSDQLKNFVKDNFHEILELDQSDPYFYPALRKMTNLNRSMVVSLLSTAENLEKMVVALGSKNIDKLAEKPTSADDEFGKLFTNRNINVEKLINLLIAHQTNFSSENILMMVYYAKDKQKILLKLGREINKLTENHLALLLGRYGEDVDFVKLIDQLYDHKTDRVQEMIDSALQ